MKFSCNQCNAQYVIADEKVGAKGVKVKCKKCANVIVVKPLITDDATTVDVPSGLNPRDALKTQQAGSESSAPRGTQGEITSAFDSMFSDGESKTSAWDSGKNASSTSGLGGDTVSGEKEWYVAIDDAQVGPIDLAEMRQRWDAREIDDDSLAWKAGMPDWVAISEIPDLAAISKNRPSRGGKQPAAVSPSAGSSAANKSAASVEWKPSAASALSSLVQEELIAARAPRESAAKTPEGMPDLGIAGFGATDLFGSKPTTPTPQDSFPDSNNSWSVPAARRGGGNKLLYIVGGGVALLVIVMLGVMMTVLLRNNNAPAPAPVAAVPTPSAPPAAAPAPAAAPTPAPAAAPAAPAPAVAEASRPAAGQAEDDGGGDEKPNQHRKGKDNAKERANHDDGGGSRKAAAPVGAR